MLGSSRRQIAEALLGNRLVRAAAETGTSTRLRVLAYHGIEDDRSFVEQLLELDRHWVPVSLDDVVAAARGDRDLPRRAVWVTFDDGRPEVLERGRALLDRTGVPATVFVCPSLIDGDRPPWWLVAAAGRLAVGGRAVEGLALVRHLKEVPDHERRAALEELERAGVAPVERQPTTEDLRRWIAAGHTVGNHTWDHPCLDRCRPDEQERQIRLADGWLESNLGVRDRVFAYPNGDWTPDAERVLGRLGVPVACLFDHRLHRRDGDSLRVSRLRVDAGASIARFRAILSGAHSLAFGLASSIPATSARRRRNPIAAASIE